uniref:Uncharacterized protein n=1 Tax=Arundo donax TaxID=35708 RepID=A0A0A9DXQ7_ARUDO
MASSTRAGRREVTLLAA